MKRSEKVNPFAAAAFCAAQLPAAQDPVRLWFGLYPATVVLLIGETGAGKSSLLYNLAVHAARNEPLWGVSFGLHRPLRVLYIDPENAGNFGEGQGGLCAVKIERIGQGKPQDLVFHPGLGVDLSKAEMIAALGDYLRMERFDLVILDPIANLFQTRDENDNAEAAGQMKALNALSRQTGVCLVAVHHTGKSSQGDYGRGASARLAAADVGLMLRCKGEDGEQDDTYSGKLKERDDLCRLQIVKNRLEGKGSLYLQMAGQDRFTFSCFAAWNGHSAAGTGEGKARRAEETVRLLLANGEWRTRMEIITAIKPLGIGRMNTDEALKTMERDGRIASQKGERGQLSYRLASQEEGSVPVFQSAKEVGKLEHGGNGQGTLFEAGERSEPPAELPGAFAH